MSCSWTWVSICARTGSECTRIRILSATTSSQAGTARSPAVLARRVRPSLVRAFRRVALRALQEELGLLPAAELAVRACVSSHVSLSPQATSDPAPLRRPAAIVRDGGHVLDRTDLQA